MKTVGSVDEYLASQPAPVRRLLEHVRTTIRKAVPRAEESISYGIPTYKLHGKPVLYFAGFKQHYSIYPTTKALLTAFRDEFASYDYNSKGTIRFSFEKPVRLIGRIAAFRAEEVTTAATKGAARPAPGRRQASPPPAGRPMKRAPSRPSRTSRP